MPGPRFFEGRVAHLPQVKLSTKHHCLKQNRVFGSIKVVVQAEKDGTDFDLANHIIPNLSRLALLER